MEPTVYKKLKHMADPKPKDPPFPAAQLLEVPPIQLPIPVCALPEAGSWFSSGWEMEGSGSWVLENEVTQFELSF